MTEKRDEFKELGRVWFREALDGDAVRRLKACASLSGQRGRRYAGDDDLTALLKASGPSAVLCSTWPNARLRRIVSFDKSDGANWQLPWHQDRVIAVRDKVEMNGFERWSQKAGVWHCEPPLEILQQILFIRLHLDPCDRASGATEIAPGSHLAGKLRKADIASRIDRYDHEVTEARPGDVLVMSMLMVHRSPPATVPSTRRALRVDYGLGDLPAPLDWAI